MYKKVNNEWNCYDTYDLINRLSALICMKTEPFIKNIQSKFLFDINERDN